MESLTQHCAWHTADHSCWVNKQVNGPQCAHPSHWNYLFPRLLALWTNTPVSTQSVSTLRMSSPEHCAQGFAGDDGWLSMHLWSGTQPDSKVRWFLPLLVSSSPPGKEGMPTQESLKHWTGFFSSFLCHKCTRRLSLLAGGPGGRNRWYPVSRVPGLSWGRFRPPQQLTPWSEG